MSLADLRRTLDHEQETALNARRQRLEAQHEAYVGSHPELQYILHDITQAVLIHKPKDPLTFLQEHVRDMKERKALVAAKKEE